MNMNQTTGSETYHGFLCVILESRMGLKPKVWIKCDLIS